WRVGGGAPGPVLPQRPAGEQPGRGTGCAGDMRVADGQRGPHSPPLSSRPGPAAQPGRTRHRLRTADAGRRCPLLGPVLSPDFVYERIRLPRLISSCAEEGRMRDADFRTPLPSRREMLRRAGAGFGSLALAALLAEESAASANPLMARRPHFQARA